MPVTRKKKIVFLHSIPASSPVVFALNLEKKKNKEPWSLHKSVRFSTAPLPFLPFSSPPSACPMQVICFTFFSKHPTTVELLLRAHY